MRIAITSTGTSLSSSIDPRFGRAKYFIIIDTKTNKFEVLENMKNMNLSQGAGIQAAATIVGQNIKAVITGNCGPKAFKALNSAQIQVYTGVEGTIEDAIESFELNELSPSKSPNVEGHW